MQCVVRLALQGADGTCAGGPRRALAPSPSRAVCCCRGVEPIVEALAASAKPPLPELDASLLRGPLHRVSLRCALPGCGAAACGDGRPLLRGSGGCQGLARYCCEEHQRVHWKDHKHWCRREGRAAAAGRGAR